MELNELPGQLNSYLSEDLSRASFADCGITSLPDWLGNVTSLTDLDLSGNRLADLPDWLGNLISLTDLDLSGNRLIALPDSLGNLTSLTKLDLSSNQLIALPDSLGNLTSLTDLDLSSNQLIALPDSLGNLTSLTGLDLSSNQLIALPNSLGNLTSLTDLDLSANQLADLPDSLGNLTALTDLDLGTNQLTALPDSLGNLTALSALRVWANSLTVLPDWLVNLTSLTNLDLSANQLTAVPDSLGSLTSLTDLDLENNRLTVLPDSLGNLTALTDLDLSANQLTALPDSLGNLTALSALRVWGNSLTALPDWLVNLTSLTNLDLSANQLTALPNWLGSLTSLTGLDLSSNQLTALPDSLGNLTALRRLSLDANELTALPECVGSLTALRSLSLGSGDLTELPEWLGEFTGLTEFALYGTQLADLPDSLSKLTTLTALRMGRNALTRLPDWLGNLTSLTELQLWDSPLNAVPDSLGSLTALTALGLRRLRLTALPNSLGNLTGLINLSLEGNQLTGLPDSLGSLTALTDLNLEGNQLTGLPDSLGSLTALTDLNLEGNQLTGLPDSLGSLTALTTLNLVRNRLTALPDALGNLTALTDLYAWDNALTALPEALGNLSTLTNLRLAANQLTVLPDWLGNLTALTELGLEGNQFTLLPDSLGNLTTLSWLDLSHNQLTTLPDCLGSLTALVALKAAGNQLAALSNSLSTLNSLSELDLSGNQLTSLPEWLGGMTLSWLDLSRNQLTALPESLGNLIALSTLRLACNKLTDLPDSLGRLTSLSELRVDGNPLRSPLLEIAEDGVAAIKAYLSLMMDDSAELWKSKLLVVGEGAVGKTSLVKALVGQGHDPNEPTTHGIRIIDLQFDHPHRPGVRMCLSSWDFGGQDIYHATHQFFLTDRSLFLFLWNARQGWEQAKLPYWLDIIKARAPHARIILVATHAEGRPIDLPLTDLKNSYSQIVASMSVDNSTGDGINELRSIMTEEAAKLPLMGSRWPATWVTGVEAITACDLQYATPEDLYHRLSAAGISELSHQTYLLRALHVLGDILYFDEDEELRDTIILRPQWVNSYIARVLDSPVVAEEHGLLTRLHERDLWSDLEPGLRDRFLLMMERFDLSYRITDVSTASSLVVERVSWDSPPYHEIWDSALHSYSSREIRLRYQLNTLPPGVPTWFIAREHRFTMGVHWRSGALLRYTGDPRVLGLVRAERQDNIVDLAVRGPVPQLFFSVLQDGFESTLSRYQGLEIARLVPCTCAHGNGTEPGKPCMYLHPYGPLLRRIEQGVEEVECALSFLKVNVASLVFGIAPTTTQQLMSRLNNIDRHLSDFRSEAAWAHREFLKALRRVQARAEAICPSVFTVTPITSRILRPGSHKLELRLYCEQPGNFHALPEPPYFVNQPTEWLVAISPYLTTVLSMLKHAAPLVGPVLGLTSDHLAKQLANETSLMTGLLSQLPDGGSALRQTQTISDAVELDVDYRLLYALLDKLDPSHNWAGLSRKSTPEGDILWLCRDHARQFGSL
jgi:internalin A